MTTIHYRRRDDGRWFSIAVPDEQVEAVTQELNSWESVDLLAFDSEDVA